MKHKRGITIGLSLLLALSCGAVQGETITWNGSATDSWSDASKWSPAKVPGAGDTVQTTAGKTLTLVGGNDFTVSALWNGKDTDGTTTLQTGAKLTSKTNITVGRQSGTGNNTGVININGGTLLSQDRIFLALTTGDSTGLSKAIVNQTAGTLQSVNNTFIGGGYLELPDGWGKKGRGVAEYNLSGGTVTAPAILVGAVRGNGTLNITGDTAIVKTTSGNLTVGYADTGTVLGANEGVGKVVQTDGTVSVANWLQIGGENSNTSSLGTGYYDISGGSINAGVLLVGTGGGTGFMTISDTAKVKTTSNFVVSRHCGTGTLTIDGETTTTIGDNFIVGGATDANTNPGTGTVYQKNGTVIVTNNLALGGFVDGNTKGTGNYYLSYGSLSAGGAFIGFKNGTGTLDISGGELTVPWMSVALESATGTVSVSKTGSLTVNGNMALGNSKGELNISGGDVKITGDLKSNAVGTKVDISGGKVNITGNIISNTVGDPNFVNFSGGTVTVDKFLYLQNRTTTISGGDLEFGRFQKTEGGNGTVQIIGGKATIDVGRFAINFAHAQTTKFNFEINSTGISTLNSLGKEPENGGDVACGTFTARTAGGVAIMNNSLYSLLHSPKIRTDDAGRSMEYMYLDNTGDWELTRTFTVDGKVVTDHGTETGTTSYFKKDVTDLRINAKLKDSAKLGVITVGEGHNGVDLDFVEGKSLDDSGWFDLSGEGKYVLELSFENAGDIDDLVSWIKDSNQGAFDVDALDDNSIVIKNLEAIAGQNQFLAFDFAAYNNPGMILADFSGKAVPEPSTWALLLIGAFGLAYVRRRQK